MKPVEFKGSNCVYAKDQPEYLPLPVRKQNSEVGEVVACWKMPFLERLKALFTGRIWVSMWIFGKPLPPSRVSVNRGDIIKGEE